MNNVFLSFHNDYEKTYVSLYQEDCLLESISETNKKSSKNLFNHIGNLLKRHKLTLKDCLFFAANQGPSPFTTLRTVITTVNGLSFATKTPLIGVDGLTTFIEEQKDHSYAYTIALLNAFCGDVYYALYTTKTKSLVITCKPIIETLTLINQLPNGSIKLLGNGVELYQNNLKTALTREATIPNPLPQTVSAHYIAQQAWKQWTTQNNYKEQLNPLYRKKTL